MKVYLLAATLVLGACVSADEATKQETVASVSPEVVSEDVQAEVVVTKGMSEELLRDINRLAAKLDQLRAQRDNPEVFMGHVDAAERDEVFLRDLAIYDRRVLDFLGRHPELEGPAREHFEQRVGEPLRALQDSYR